MKIKTYFVQKKSNLCLKKFIFFMAKMFNLTEKAFEQKKTVLEEMCDN